MVTNLYVKMTKLFFKDIFSLSPGEYIKINKKQFIKKKYWHLRPKIDNSITQNEALEESGETLAKFN